MNLRFTTTHEHVKSLGLSSFDSLTLPIILFPSIEALSKFSTFLGTSKSSSLFKPFELNSNEFEFKSCNHAHFYFLGTSAFL